MKLSFSIATPSDAIAIAVLRNAAAEELTARFGKGPWSMPCSEKGIVRGMEGKSKTLIAKSRGKIVGTLVLQTKKPWSIDINHFTKVPVPLYLISMAVHPDFQRKGVGKYMLEAVVHNVASWPAQAFRLDAFDAEAGAGDFYRKCGLAARGRVVYRNVPLLYFEKVLI